MTSEMRETFSTAYLFITKKTFSKVRKSAWGYLKPFDVIIDVIIQNYDNFFQELVEKVKFRIQKQTTRIRNPLSPEEKLACTLRYLATGESYASLQYQFRISKSAISLFVPEVCATIYESLKDEYMRMPATENEWKELSEEIYANWQFPNSIGTMDGKHIAIFNPANSGSTFYNYKKFYIIVLLGLVKHNYQFLYANPLLSATVLWTIFLKTP